MKKYCCKDAGIECNWTVFDENEERVVRRAREHAEQAHKSTRLQDDASRIRAAIRTT
jgi:predicted small metal-binding protein